MEQRKSRTVFTSEQKEEMGKVAEKIQWRSHSKRKREDEEEVYNFINHSGLDEKTFEKWMQNNRKSYRSSQCSASSSASISVDALSSMTTFVDINHDKENLHVSANPQYLTNNTVIGQQFSDGRKLQREIIINNGLPLKNISFNQTFPPTKEPFTSSLPTSSTQQMSEDDMECLENQSFINQRKSRTLFTPDQKEAMSILAEKIGWTVQSRRLRKYDEEVHNFVNRSGVSRETFLTWMQNHRKTNDLIQINAGSLTRNCTSTMPTDTDRNHDNQNEHAFMEVQIEQEKDTEPDSSSNMLRFNSMPQTDLDMHHDQQQSVPSSSTTVENNVLEHIYLSGFSYRIWSFILFSLGW